MPSSWRESEPTPATPPTLPQAGRHRRAQHRPARLRARQITWEGYVRLAFEELTLAGAGSPQVARPLFAALDDLLATAPATRRPPLERQRELLALAVEDAYGDWREIESAQVPDIQGIGSGPNVAAAPGAVEAAAR